MISTSFIVRGRPLESFSRLRLCLKPSLTTHAPRDKKLFVEITRENRLLALCLSTVLVFFVQSMFCFADQIGMAPCCDADQSEHHDTSTPDGPSSACCCQNSNTVLAVEVLVALPLRQFSVGMIFQTDDAAPEGPVQKIDYPPQLS